jgi:hypothetical protein
MLNGVSLGYKAGKLVMRKLHFLFQEPGLLEAIASDPDMPQALYGLNTPGYQSRWVADLMVDVDPRTNQPYAFMSTSFDKHYPLIIWALKMHMADERFDVPQAGLRAIPLHEAFSWAYAHFVLEDQIPNLPKRVSPGSGNLTSQVLR